MEPTLDDPHVPASDCMLRWTTRKGRPRLPRASLSLARSSSARSLLLDLFTSTWRPSHQSSQLHSGRTLTTASTSTAMPSGSVLVPGLGKG